MVMVLLNSRKNSSVLQYFVKLYAANFNLFFLFQSLYWQMIYLLFIAAVTGSASMKVFIPAHQNIE